MQGVVRKCHRMLGRLGGNLKTRTMTGPSICIGGVGWAPELPDTNEVLPLVRLRRKAFYSNSLLDSALGGTWVRAKVVQELSLGLVHVTSKSLGSFLAPPVGQ